MSLFSNDSEFLKLLAHRRDIDLIDVSLELARDANPDLDFRPTQNWINDQAFEVGRISSVCRSEHAVLDNLVSHLVEECGLRGDPAVFHRPESSYLPHVIETGLGIPISLSVIYMEIARRAGIELQGIPAPLHFLSRHQTERGAVFVDAYSAGRMLSQTECLHWLQAQTGLSAEQIIPTLRTASPRQIVIRMLNNLRGIYCRNEDWSAAFRVQQRLAALNPIDYDAQVDLGQLALRANVPGPAYDVFRRCATHSGRKEPQRLQMLLREAKRRIALRN